VGPRHEGPLIETDQALVSRLAAAGCVRPEDEAEALRRGAPDQATLAAWVARREEGEPLAWITGTTLFCGHTLRVEPGVYVPRPQTEELARRAATLLGAKGMRAADLCTGAGAIAVHLQAEVPSATVVAADLDLGAVGCARRNGVPAIVDDVGHALRAEAFDVVTAVPPYVPTAELSVLPSDVQRFEPRRALDGGPDGLDVARRLVASAGRLLRPGGWLLLEVGADQDRVLEPALDAAGFGVASTWADDDDDLRGLAARLEGRR
jgi:release factor glutamine methyltransferase